MISIKRVYTPASAEDGQRFLVDRLWPRGVKKEDLKWYLGSRRLPPVTIYATGMGMIQTNGVNSTSVILTSWMLTPQPGTRL